MPIKPAQAAWQDKPNETTPLNAERLNYERVRAQEIVEQLTAETGAWLPLESINKVSNSVAGFLKAEVRTTSTAAIAELRGVLKTTAAIAEGNRIFTVPVAVRPAAKILVQANLTNAGVQTLNACLAQIETNGEFIVKAVAAETELFLLDGIQWSLT